MKKWCVNQFLHRDVVLLNLGKLCNIVRKVLHITGYYEIFSLICVGYGIYVAALRRREYASTRVLLLDTESAWEYSVAPIRSLYVALAKVSLRLRFCIPIAVRQSEIPNLYLFHIFFISSDWMYFVQLLFFSILQLVDNEFKSCKK